MFGSSYPGQIYPGQNGIQTTVNQIIEVDDITISTSTDNVSLTFPSLSTLSDNFNDNTINTSIWSIVGYAHIDLTAGNTQLKFYVEDTLSPSYGNIVTDQRYDVTGSIASIEITRFPTNGDDGLLIFGLRSTSDRFVSEQRYEFVLGETTIDVQATVDSMGAFYTSLTLDETNHKFLRFRESGGDIYFEYSPDYTNWTAFGDAPLPSGDSSSFHVSIGAATSGASFGVTEFSVDNLNFPPDVILAPADILVSTTIDNTTISQNHIISPADISNGLNLDSTTLVVPFEALTDDFSSGSLGSNWSIFRGSVSVVSEQVLFEVNSSTSQSTLITTGYYTLENSYIQFQIVSLDSNRSYTYFVNFDDFYGWGYDASTNEFYMVTDEYGNGDGVTHVDGNYYRIRESAGTIYWEYSTNGHSWTLVDSVLDTNSNALELVQLGFSLLVNGTEDGSMVVDNINIDPVEPVLTTDISVSTTVDTTTITQNHVISPQDVSIATTADSTAITQNHTVTPDDISINVSIDTTTLIQNYILAVQDILLSTSIDNTSIIYNYIVAVQDILVSLSEDTTTITQNHVIVPQDVAISTLTDNTTIVEQYVLSPADITLQTSTDNTLVDLFLQILTDDISLSLSSDNTNISQNHIIETQDILTSLSIEEGNVDLFLQILTDDINLSTSIDSTTIEQNYILDTQDISIDVTLGETTVPQTHTIEVNNVLISTSTDNGTIIENGQIGVQDIAVSTYVDNTTITQNHTITPQDVSISLEINQTTILVNHIFSPNDISLSTLLDEATTVTQNVLTPQDITISTLIENTSITQLQIIATQDILLSTSLDRSFVGIELVQSPNGEGVYNKRTSTTGNIVTSSNSMGVYNKRIYSSGELSETSNDSGSWIEG